MVNETKLSSCSKLKLLQRQTRAICKGNVKKMSKLQFATTKCSAAASGVILKVSHSANWNICPSTRSTLEFYDGAAQKIVYFHVFSLLSASESWITAVMSSLLWHFAAFDTSSAILQPLAPFQRKFMDHQHLHHVPLMCLVTVNFN